MMDKIYIVVEASEYCGHYEEGIEFVCSSKDRAEVIAKALNCTHDSCDFKVREYDVDSVFRSSRLFGNLQFNFEAHMKEELKRLNDETNSILKKLSEFNEKEH